MLLANLLTTGTLMHSAQIRGDSRLLLTLLPHFQVSLLVGLVVEEDPMGPGFKIIIKKSKKKKKVT